jgi:hypothetical protein
VSRTAHYQDFYGEPARDGRPLGLVHGNCQAEALRVLLAGSPTLPWQLLRVPPVHELEAGDLPHLDRLLAGATLLLAQPVRDGYRGCRSAPRSWPHAWPPEPGSSAGRSSGGRACTRGRPSCACPTCRAAVVPYHDLPP